MTRGWRGTAMRLLGAKDHLVTVTQARTITDSYVRIHFYAPTLIVNDQPAPAEFLRFWFPGSEADPQEYQRAYTVTSADLAQHSFAIEAVLHDTAGLGATRSGAMGPAGAWCAAAAPGDNHHS